MSGLVFACIAPHGSIIVPLLTEEGGVKALATRAAMEELGRRMAAAQPETIHSSIYKRSRRARRANRRPSSARCSLSSMRCAEQLVASIPRRSTVHVQLSPITASSSRHSWCVPFQTVQCMRSTSPASQWRSGCPRSEPRDCSGSRAPTGVARRLVRQSRRAAPRRAARSQP